MDKTNWSVYLGDTYPAVLREQSKDCAQELLIIMQPNQKSKNCLPVVKIVTHSPLSL